MGRSAIYGNNRILAWQNPKPFPVYSLSIASWTTAEGEWKFSDVKGQSSISCTK